MGMIGNVVYIIVCHYFRENNRQIETVHATWDGAFKRLQRIKEINEDAGYEVTESENGYIDCRLNGRLVYEYLVVTKTIEK